MASGSLTGGFGFSTPSLTLTLGEVDAAKCGSMICGPLGVTLAILLTFPAFNIAGRLLTRVLLNFVYLALFV